MCVVQQRVHFAAIALCYSTAHSLPDYNLDGRGVNYYTHKLLIIPIYTVPLPSVSEITPRAHPSVTHDGTNKGKLKSSEPA